MPTPCLGCFVCPLGATWPVLQTLGAATQENDRQRAGRQELWSGRSGGFSPVEGKGRVSLRESLSAGTSGSRPMGFGWAVQGAA